MRAPPAGLRGRARTLCGPVLLTCAALCCETSTGGQLDRAAPLTRCNFLFFSSRRKHAALCAAGTPEGGAGAPQPLALPRALPTGAAAPGAPGALAGLRLGIFRAWFDDADAEVVAACRRAVALLVDRGAQARARGRQGGARAAVRQRPLGAARRCVDLAAPELARVTPAGCCSGDCSGYHSGCYPARAQVVEPTVLELELARMAPAGF